LLKNGEIDFHQCHVIVNALKKWAKVPFTRPIQTFMFDSKLKEFMPVYARYISQYNVKFYKSNSSNNQVSLHVQLVVKF